MLGQSVPRHAIALVDQSLDELGRKSRLDARALARCRAVGQHPVELGQQERDRPAHAQVFGAIDIALQQVFDFLLPAPALGEVGRAFGVETEQHGIAIGEEFLDGLFAAERDVLALVILDDQVESRGAVIEPELELGLGERAGHGLARLELGDLLREILGALRVGGRQPQAGHPAAGGLAIKHRQQRGLAHVAMAKKRDPLRPAEARFQGVESGPSAVVLAHASKSFRRRDHRQGVAVHGVRRSRPLQIRSSDDG